MSTYLTLPPSTLLQLMWLASPALPIGGFSYSEGLEAAVNAELVGQEAEAANWLLQQLQLTQARGDMAAIAQAMPAWAQADLPRIAVEMGASDSWWKYGCAAVVGIDTFGESAPASVLLKHFGFTPENVADTVQAVLADC